MSDNLITFADAPHLTTPKEKEWGPNDLTIGTTFDLHRSGLSRLPVTEPGLSWYPQRRGTRVDALIFTQILEEIRSPAHPLPRPWAPGRPAPKMYYTLTGDIYNRQANEVTPITWVTTRDDLYQRGFRSPKDLLNRFFTRGLTPIVGQDNLLVTEFNSAKYSVPKNIPERQIWQANACDLSYREELNVYTIRDGDQQDLDDLMKMIDEGTTFAALAQKMIKTNRSLMDLRQYRYLYRQYQIPQHTLRPLADQTKWAGAYRPWTLLDLRIRPLCLGATKKK